MKTLILLFSVIFTTMSFSQVPNYVPANGLVGWWPFNGNANDESGNGNNGTVNGATLTIDRNGVANQAYTFDVNQKIGTFITNFPVYSVSIWAKINTWNLGIGTFNGGALASHKTDGFYGNGWGLEHNGTNNQNQWSWFEYNGNNYVQQYNGTPQLNAWFHVVLTSDSQGSRKLYIDGILTDTYNGAAIISGGNNYEFKIGALIDGQTIWWFKGDLDDVGYWNRALTDCEIQDLYHSQPGSQAISAGLDQSICTGDNVTLNGSGGSNYQWDNNVVDGQAFAPGQSDSYVVNGTDTIGCQGSDTVVITVLENATSSLTQTALDSYTLNGQTYTESGTYTQTIPSVNGCDSVITLNLTLNFTGLSQEESTLFVLYPNPASEQITIKTDAGMIGKEYALYNQVGKLITKGKLTGENTSLSLQGLARGLYSIAIQGQEKKSFTISKE